MKKKVITLLGLGVLPVTSVFAEEVKPIEKNKVQAIEKKITTVENIQGAKEKNSLKEVEEVKDKTVKKENKKEKNEKPKEKNEQPKGENNQSEKVIQKTEENQKNGWQLDSNGWRYYKKGKIVTKEWIFDTKEGAWYYLSKSGEYVKNTWVTDYYLGSNGKMLASQWLFDPSYNGWYYLTKSGAYANATWVGDYYLKQYGKMADAEWIYDPNYQSWYYLNNGGSYARSQWAGNYYLLADGKMAKKAWVDSEKYYVDGNGKWVEYVKPLNTPWYFQRDSKWGAELLRGITMGVSGCVPTSLSMIFNGFGENTTPIEVARWISKNTEYMNTNGYVGTSAKGSAAALKAWGYDYKIINTRGAVKQALVEGKTILACVGQGHFVGAANATHAIVLSGYQDGKTFVRDPENNGNSRWFDIDNLWNQRSFDEGDNELGGPFMVVEKVAHK
ncbi:MAG: C39 family peptidase [Granulicatella sp.]|nr:C39 family peptidase [Granulicatella sp.]